MLTLGTTGRIWVCVEAVDGRKSFDGLAAIVSTQLGRDPLSGDLFVFKNRRGDRLKILAWQGDGFALYLRRLERGTFAFPTADAAEVSVTATELAMIHHQEIRYTGECFRDDLLGRTTNREHILTNHSFNHV
jgi:transposase